MDKASLGFIVLGLQEYYPETQGWVDSLAFSDVICNTPFKQLYIPLKTSEENLIIYQDNLLYLALDSLHFYSWRMFNIVSAISRICGEPCAQYLRGAFSVFPGIEALLAFLIVALLYRKPPTNMKRRMTGKYREWNSFNQWVASHLNLFTQRVTNILFSLAISPLNHTLTSQTNSPCQYLKKCIENSM